MNESENEFIFFSESVNEIHIDFNQIIMQFSGLLFFQCVAQWLEWHGQKKESEVWKIVLIDQI